MKKAFIPGLLMVCVIMALVLARVNPLLWPSMMIRKFECDLERGKDTPEAQQCLLDMGNSEDSPSW